MIGWPILPAPALPYGTVVVDRERQVIYSGQSQTPIYDALVAERARA